MLSIESDEISASVMNQLSGDEPLEMDVLIVSSRDATRIPYHRHRLRDVVEEVERCGGNHFYRTEVLDGQLSWVHVRQISNARRFHLLKRLATRCIWVGAGWALYLFNEGTGTYASERSGAVTGVPLIHHELGSKEDEPHDWCHGKYHGCGGTEMYDVMKDATLAELYAAEQYRIAVDYSTLRCRYVVLDQSRSCIECFGRVRGSMNGECVVGNCRFEKCVYAHQLEVDDPRLAGLCVGCGKVRNETVRTAENDSVKKNARQMSLFSWRTFDRLMMIITPAELSRGDGEPQVGSISSLIKAAACTGKQIICVPRGVCDGTVVWVAHPTISDADRTLLCEWEGFGWRASLHQENPALGDVSVCTIRDVTNDLGSFPFSVKPRVVMDSQRSCLECLGRLPSRGMYCLRRNCDETDCIYVRHVPQDSPLLQGRCVFCGDTLRE